MNNLSIIIPSRTLSNLTACVGAIRERGETCRIIVVDDTDGQQLMIGAGRHRLTLANKDAGILSGHRGERPFIFSRNINIGIRAAGTDDVIILGDDGLLKTWHGFTHLQEAADSNPDYGVIASTCNNVGRRTQWPRNPSEGLRFEPIMVCFVAVCIPRSTIDRVGLMDEEFTKYGYDDYAYCKRTQAAGLKIGIHDGCYVDHKSLPSTFRAPGMDASLKHNREVFFQKFGEYPA